MDWRRALWFGLAGSLLVGYVLLHTGLLPVPTGVDDRRGLRVTDCEETVRGRLDVAVAESFAQQYVGLSRTESLADEEGMLFVHDEDGERGIGMRNMDFPLDVLFVSADGEITSVETLDAPDSPLSYYVTYGTTSGQGRYVVEANAGWSEARGVSAGDCVRGLPR
ncbi:DUF192 domain-containing protein [Halorussus halobius]|uniref:DUF192 domain-containing protein n=1 Tax=Halorussus halobius TaxID=1710537 RepID=UPI001092F4A5|nr:DUF192 domain-containing protein [Halorussus halobius]